MRSESDAERNFAHQPLGRVAQCTTAEIYQSSSSRPRPRNCPKTEDEAEDGEQTIHIIKIFWATRSLISTRAFDTLLEAAEVFEIFLIYGCAPGETAAFSFLPFPGFHVTIGKSQIRAARVMAIGRNIEPIILKVLTHRNHAECGIGDFVGIGIDENEQRGGRTYFRLFGEMIGLLHVDAVAHVETAIAQLARFAGDSRCIRRAMIDRGIAIVVEEQGICFADGIGIQSGNRAAPTDIVISQRRLVRAAHGDVINIIIRHEVVVVVVRVHVEAQLQLTKVVDAIDGLRAGPATAQHRQQQAGENRNDGDDHEQFDERESAALRG